MAELATVLGLAKPGLTGLVDGGGTPRPRRALCWPRRPARRAYRPDRRGAAGRP